MVSTCGSSLWFEATETIVDLCDVDGLVNAPLEFSFTELLTFRQAIVVETGIDMRMLLIVI